jgi:hypothetical protein
VVNRMVNIYHLIKSFFSGVERAQESKKIYKRKDKHKTNESNDEG